MSQEMIIQCYDYSKITQNSKNIYTTSNRLLETDVFEKHLRQFYKVHNPTKSPHEVKKLTVEQLTRQLEESKALLPGLALYQIHSASLDVLQAPALPPPPPPASNSTQFLLRHRHCPILHHRTKR